jgi:uncharacterized glyoxalase superfamily protein PhnB
MICPYLIYEDAPAAIRFLSEAYGFEEKLVYPMPDGRVGHAELVLGDSMVMLASIFEGFGTSPRQLPDVHGFSYVYVEDVDAHFARAKAAGATLVTEPTDEHGTRSYRTTDPEGHRWVFSTPLA